MRALQLAAAVSHVRLRSPAMRALQLAAAVSHARLRSPAMRALQLAAAVSHARLRSPAMRALRLGAAVSLTGVAPPAIVAAMAVANSEEHAPAKGLLGGVAALLLLLAFIYQPWTVGPPPPRGSDDSNRSPTGQPGDAVRLPRAQAPRTSPALLAPPPPADLSLPHAFELEVRVTDAFGLPVPDAHLFAAPPECAFGLVPTPTDARGYVQFSCRGRRPELRLWIAVLARGVIEAMQVVALDSSQPAVVAVLARGEIRESTELEKLMAAGMTEEALARFRERQQQRRQELGPGSETLIRRGKLRRRDGYDMICGRSILLFDGMACLTCHDPARVQAYHPFEFARDLSVGMHGATPFADLRRSRPNADERTQRERRLAVRKAPDAEEWQRRLARRTEQDLGRVHGQIRTPDGDSPGIVPIAWVDERGALRFRAMTDAAGRYGIELPAGNAHRLIAGGGGDGRASTYVVPVTGLDVEQDFTLERTLEIRGIATDEHGAPLSDWRVTFFNEHEPRAAMALTRDDGSFLVLPIGVAGRCLLWPRDPDLWLPVLATHVDSSNGRRLKLQLPAEPPTRAHLRLRAGLPPGFVAAAVEMRLLQVDTGFATHLIRTGFDEAFELEALPAGPYRGEVGAPGLGWVTFGPLFLDGRGLWDCGTVYLPAPGRLVLEVAQGSKSPLAGEFAFYRQTRDVDIEVPVHIADDGSVSLPGGRYALLWIDDGEQRSMAFTIESARDTAVAVTLQ